MKNPIEQWHEVVKLRDYSLLETILSEDVIFYSPVVYTPQKGKKIALQYLAAASEVFNTNSFRYNKVIVMIRCASLEFSLNINETDINLQMISLYEEGYQELLNGDTLYAANKFREAELIFPQSEWAPMASLMSAYALSLIHI